MKITLKNPFISWAVWSTFFGMLFIVVMIQFLGPSLKADKSGISTGIIFLFLTGWTISFIHALSLTRDWKSLNRPPDSITKIEDGHEAGIVKLLHTVQNKSEQGMSISFENVITSYRMRMDGPRRIVVAFSSILITIGLIGTILGLINSMAGLNDIIMSVTTSRESLITGLQHTLSGMGTAFYSTLYGAIFGGVMLRLLANNALSSESSILGTALEYLELNVGHTTSPRSLDQTAIMDTTALNTEQAILLNAVKAAQLEIINFTSIVNREVMELSKSIGTINNEMRSYSVALIDSRLLQVSAHLQDVAQSMKSLTSNI